MFIKKYKIKTLLLGALLSLAGFAPAYFSVPHISLISPKPLLDGYAKNGRAQKVAPFGAPDINALSADSTPATSGGQVELDIDMYVYHAGEIVVLYTTDPTGADIAPAMTLASAQDPIPHKNLMYRQETPCVLEGDKCLRGRKGAMTFKMTVPLPDIEGDIYLVVRQIMTDQIQKMEDGSARLDRVYYHQTAKLSLKRL